MQAYTEDEDRFLICAMHKFGHGNWDQIRQGTLFYFRFLLDLKK